MTLFWCHFQEKSQIRSLCIVQGILDNETEVMCLVQTEASGLFYKTNENDISVITNDQVLRKLDTPEFVITGDRIKYKFKSPIDK